MSRERHLGSTQTITRPSINLNMTGSKDRETEEEGEGGCLGACVGVFGWVVVIAGIMGWKVPEATPVNLLCEKTIRLTSQANLLDSSR